MTKCASAVGRAASRSVSTLTPENQVSNFDQVVTQWMAPRYSDGGSRCASSQVQVVGDSTRPSTVMLHVSGAIRGVGSAVSTGQSAPTSYCPGGRRASLCRRRPRNPRVAPGMTSPPDGSAARGAGLERTLTAGSSERVSLRELDHSAYAWPQPVARPSVVAVV